MFLRWCIHSISSRVSTKQPSKRGKSYRCKVWMSPIEVGKIIPVRQSVSSAPSRQVSPSRRLISPCLRRRKISKCWGNRGLRACINVNCMYWEETCRHFGWFFGRGRYINRLHIFRFIIKFGYNACCHSLKERAQESIEHRAGLNLSRHLQTVRAITISGYGYRFRALWLGEIKTKTKQIWPRGAGNKKKLIFFFFCGGHVVMR